MHHRGMTRAAVQQASKNAGGTTVQAITRVDAVGMQLLLNKLEQFGVDDRVVFAFVDFIAVGDFAQIDAIVKRGVPTPIKQPLIGSWPPIEGDVEARAIAYFKPSEAWEMDCLKAFVAQEFSSRDLSGVEWALQTHLLSYEELDAKEKEVGEAYLLSPDSDESWIVSGLYWLSMARKWSGNGWSSRGA